MQTFHTQSIDAAMKRVKPQEMAKAAAAAATTTNHDA